MAIGPRILVVGAGPTGLVAAIELVRRGFRPRIVDKEAGPPAESRALGINPRTLAILEPSGATERLLAAGVKIRGAVLRTRERVLLELDLSLIGGRFPFILVLPQGDVEAILGEVLDESGIAVEWRTELTRLDMTGGKPLAVLQGAAGEEGFRPDIVIGADGAHSSVRDALGLAFSGSAYDTRWGLADVVVDTSLPLDRVNVFDLAPVLFAVIPIRGSKVRLVCDHPNVLDHLPPEVRVDEVLWQGAFRIAHRQVRTYRRGAVFLAGDAAHVHSPLGARGMNLGIEDAAWLAWLIAEDRTSRYDADRRPVGRHVLRTVDRNTRLMASDNMLARGLRRRLMPALLRLPALQRLALRRLSGADTPSPPWLDRG